VEEGKVGSRASPRAREKFDKGVYSRKNERDGITYWFIRYTAPDGSRRKEKAGTQKQDARDMLTKRKAAILNDTWVDPWEKEVEQGPKFSEFEKRFLADYAGRCRSDHYSGILRRVRERIGDPHLREIKRADLDQYAARRLREASGSTVRKELMALGTFFKMAVRWGVLETSPAADLQKPPEPQHKVRYLSVDEWRRLEAVAPPWLKPMLTLAVATGMRLKEVVSMTWDDVDRKTGLLHVAEDTKTGTRAIPMNATVREVLDGLVRHVRSPYVFLDSGGEPYTSREARLRITRATIAAMGKAQIADATFHTLRHTAASLMVQAGVELFEVQRILGHSTPAMTQRYSHLKPDHLRRGVEAIDAALRSGPISAPTHQAELKPPTSVPGTPASVVPSGSGRL